MRWWVVRGGALGDFILTTPAIATVRAAASALTLFATPRYAALWPGLADEVVDLRGPEALPLFGGGPLPAPLPDAALVYTPGVAAALIAAGVPLVREAAPRPPAGVHACDHLLAPLADLLPPAPAPPLRPRPDVLAALEPRLPAPRPIVLAPGAASPDKIWGGFAAVAERLIAEGWPVVWAPGRDEPPPPMTGPALRDLDLPTLVALASRAAAWLGNDTGTTHLAAAAGAPVLALFGPTSPACWAPRPGCALSFDTHPEEVLKRLLVMCCQNLTA